MPDKGSKVTIGNLVDGFYPSRIQLNAKFKKGFAYKTIGHRLPVILTKIIDQLSQDKNEIGTTLGEKARDEVKVVVGALAKLKNEMVTNKPITPVSSQVWNQYLLQVAKTSSDGKLDDVRWYWAPWLYVECYLYHRVKDAFLSTTSLTTYDYFRKQKEEGFLSSLGPAQSLSDFMLKAEISQSNLQSLLEVALWGNTCDLSMSSGEKVSQVLHLQEHLHVLEPFILSNDSSKFWSMIKSEESLAKIEKELNSNVVDPQPLTNEEMEIEGKKEKITIGYVLDNSGFELFTDLCFADALLAIVDKIDFYVKVDPWFISDALETDMKWMLDYLISSEVPSLSELGQRWNNNFLSERWRVIVEPFWTYPHAFHEMRAADPTLYEKLSSYTALIFKGDLNYRKLVGDINWEHDTPFVDALQGFIPAPLLSLRTIKADTVAGLRPGLGEEMDKKEPDWMITGKYALIQTSN